MDFHQLTGVNHIYYFFLFYLLRAYSVTTQFYILFFSTSTYIIIDILLHLFTPMTWVKLIIFTGVLVGLRCTWQNHLMWFFLSHPHLWMDNFMVYLIVLGFHSAILTLLFYLCLFMNTVHFHKHIAS